MVSTGKWVAFPLIPKNASTSLRKKAIYGDEIKSFAIIRDPFDRILSAWANPGGYGFKNLNEFVDYLCSTPDHDMKDHHLVSQFFHILPHKLISFNDLDKLKELGVSLAITNPSASKATLTDEMKTKLRDRFAGDFILWELAKKEDHETMS